jgi:hypothetical protein
MKKRRSPLRCRVSRQGTQGEAPLEPWECELFIWPCRRVKSRGVVYELILLG